MADRTLHIGVDGRELVGQPTGVGRYLAEVLKAWATARLPHRVTVFVPTPPPAALAALGPAIAWDVLPSSRAGTVWEQTRLRRAARRANLDVFFAPGYTAPLGLACPTVVAIHDLSYFAHPEWFGWREGFRRRWLTRAAARRAALVLTISEFSRGEIVRYLGVPTPSIRLALPGAPAIPSASALSPRDPLVLSVGSLFNRRRIPELLAGFAALGARVPDARLILVGANRTAPRIDPMAVAAGLGIGSRVTWRDYVNDAELDQLYARARAFAFLSDYEGFAMTPLEALAHGVPVVLLDTPVAREVYADAASFVSLDPAAIANALEPLLSDAGAHRDAVARGARRLGAFSWDRTAAIVRAALEAASEARR